MFNLFNGMETAAILNYKYDSILHPYHYTQGKIQPIEVIEDWNLNYRVGSVIKYIGRAKHKGSELMDLKKAKWFLEREITALEKEYNLMSTKVAEETTKCVK